ncbi:hypothetical protein Nepgr_002701 [Nepenthes gracilis]|uniref:Uncharacterized protein n=1 Tax=Nepenthes gracilis TaxID=150966 RepID=A0AAD3PA89_NEPGR|nr:hypothetical protein Nepgr_002701 [Nepenthes gracilis]
MADFAVPVLLENWLQHADVAILAVLGSAEVDCSLVGLELPANVDCQFRFQPDEGRSICLTYHSLSWPWLGKLIRLRVCFPDVALLTWRPSCTEILAVLLIRIS